MGGMTGDATAAAPAGGDGGIPGRSQSHVTVSREPFNDCSADLDAALVGLIALDDPAARDVDETWCDAPRWREAARALLSHRRSGRRLGDLLSAADALAERAAGLYLPQTTPAEAILAALEAAPARYVVEHAGERLVRLRLRRLARLLDLIADADLDVIPRQVARVRDELGEIGVSVPVYIPLERVCWMRRMLHSLGTCLTARVLDAAHDPRDVARWCRRHLDRIER
jgi:hypothetical protein